MATSQNGYGVFLEARTTGPLPRLRKWIIPSTGRHMLCRDGSAGFLLAHLTLWYHGHIEPIGGGVYDDWAWAVRPVRGQTSGYSNHASGTAVDIDATQHPRGVPTSRTFSKAEIDKIHAQLKVYGGTIRWGGDYTRNPDGMHFEIDKPLPAVEAKARELWNSLYGTRVLAANPGAASIIWDGQIPAKRPTERRWVDYSYDHPTPAAIKAGGYLGAMRYISTKATKVLTAPEAKALRAAGLRIGLVWEEAPARAGKGMAAGLADVKNAEAMADKLGYPTTAVIFYAVDYDAAPAAVRGYFDGVKAGARRPVGVYGSAKIVAAGLAPWRWQTAAWSAGVVSSSAHMLQRVTRIGDIPGYHAGWDENLLIADFPSWGPNNPEDDMPLNEADLAKIQAMFDASVEKVADRVLGKRSVVYKHPGDEPDTKSSLSSLTTNTNLRAQRIEDNTKPEETAEPPPKV